MPKPTGDPRLICERCGEIGRLAEVDGGAWIVTCQGYPPAKHGMCCQTYRCASAEIAISCWEHMQPKGGDDAN